MRSFGKWLGRVLLALLVIGAALYFWKREEITRLTAVNTLFDAEKITHNFSNMNTMFHSTPVPRGAADVSPLPIGSPLALPEGYDTWVKARATTGIVVLKDGLLRHEAYYQGTGPDDLRISWSVAKSFTSALIGILLEDGKVGALSDPVTQYAPALKGSAYDGARIEDVLQMESGVRFNEDYFDFWSDINKMGRVLALGGSMDGFAADVDERIGEAGAAWKYVSIDTHVLSMVIRGATGRSLAELMSEKIIAPLGLEREPYFVTDGEGVAFALGGLNLTTRDYARFGQMIEQNGAWQGAQIVPAAWVAASTRPSAKTAEGKRQYGYQWWMPADARQGEFFAHGVYGQYIYVNKPLGVVIAVNASDKGFRNEGVSAGNIEMFRQIAEAAQ